MIKTKSSKVQAMSRTANMEVFAEETHTECEVHTARITQLEGDFDELKGKLDFLKRRNNVADLQYSMLSDDCYSLKRQIASGGKCGGEMVQRLANVSKDVAASIHDLNCHAAHAQKAVQDFFCNNSVAVAEYLWTFFQQKAATSFYFCR